jgi:hypothetical protein
LSYYENESALRFSGCPLIFIFDETALPHAFFCREPALVCGRIIVSPRKFSLLNRSFYRRGRRCVGRPFRIPLLPRKQDGLENAGRETRAALGKRSLLSAIQAFIHSEEIHRRAIAPEIISSPNCGWSGPVAMEIVENRGSVETVNISPLSICHEPRGPKAAIWLKSLTKSLNIGRNPSLGPPAKVVASTARNASLAIGECRRVAVPDPLTRLRVLAPSLNC